MKQVLIALATLIGLAALTPALGLSMDYRRFEGSVRNRADEILRASSKHHRLTNLTTPEMIIANGYPAEVHHVTTEDGYILELHRIPHGPNETRTPNDPRPIVFLHHCLLCSSSDFIMNDPPEKALAYLLASKGYDVWLANARGNTYSKNHVSLSPSEEAFWEFSWHEMGYYDLPAAIDYVLYETGQKDLNYIGFSMGTTVFWVLMSERPEYASKVRFMVAMGPVAFVENMEGPLKYLSWFSSTFMKTLKLLGRHEIFSFGTLMDNLVTFFCDEERWTSAICHNSLFLITGSNPDQLNKEMLPVILAHTPAGTSARTLHHYLQEVRSGYFRKFDFGTKGNEEAYGQTDPPIYHLERATPPVALFWSKNDWLASPADVLHLLAKLPHVVHIAKIEDDHFTHLDFIWALQADTLLYYPILDLLSQYQDGNAM
ncbi:lipase lipl-1-like [Macrobrachium nipponense]|uniref:lipase lipl-1-like n=1 Tax=Macrobrachium nipponense TaxID=159736 RepID=UPI0030C8D09A